MKTCGRCGETKPLSEFCKRSGTPSGYAAWCKACARAYHHEHKEKANAYSRAYYREHIDRLKEQAKKHREENKEKIHAYLKAWQDVNREKINAKQREWHRQNREAARAYKQSLTVRQRDRNNRLRDLYGITLQDYDSMLAAQNGVCAICGEKRSRNRSSKHLAVDHDHKTGVVRGLLCDDCNNALGRIQDNPERALRLYEYLKFHEDLISQYLNQPLD